jgi:hypothetical protein
MYLLSISLSLGSVLTLVSSFLSHVSFTTPTTRLGWRHTYMIVSNCLGPAVHDLFFFCFLFRRGLLTHVLDTLPYLTSTPASPIVFFTHLWR